MAAWKLVDRKVGPDAMPTPVVRAPHALLQLVVGLGGALDGHLRVELRAHLHVEPELITREAVVGLRPGQPGATGLRDPVPAGEEVRLYQPAGSLTLLGRKLMNMDRRRE